MIRNRQVLKDFLVEYGIEADVDAVAKAAPECIICPRKTCFIGIYDDEDNDTYQFYGLCPLHAPHVKNLEAKILAALAAKAVTPTAVRGERQSAMIMDADAQFETMPMPCIGDPPV